MCVCRTLQFHDAVIAVGLASPDLFVGPCPSQKSHPSLSFAGRFSQQHHLHVHFVHRLGLIDVPLLGSGSWKKTVLSLVPEEVWIYLQCEGAARGKGADWSSVLSRSTSQQGDPVPSCIPH